MSKTSLVVLACVMIGAVLIGPKPALAVPPANFQTTQIVGSGLSGPTGLGIAPDGRIFILERTGAVKIYKSGQLLTTPFITLPTLATGDRGLIGVAFDPQFSVNKFVYFYYTGTDQLNYVVRFSAATDIATDGPVIIYHTTSISQQLHVGGSIGFAPDGTLYLAIGDNGYGPNSQALDNPHGKIVRINKDGTIPSDNPFIGSLNVLPEIWAFGLRNPWRFQFDSLTGFLYDSDVGQNTWEEVNRIVKGANYGWPTCEGVCATPGFTSPIYSYNHNSQSMAITGGPVYRGTMFPASYYGRYFFGDYAAGFIKTLGLDPAGNSTGVSDFDLNAGSVVDLKVATDGSLYYITYYPGRLYRISYSTGNQIPIASATADVTKGVNPLSVQFSSVGSFDPDGTVLSYLWDFGDGTTSTQANPTKLYSLRGAYTVELTVSDGVNPAQSVPIVIQVGIAPTVTIGSPLNGVLYNAGDTIVFTASAIDGVGNDINDNAISTEILFHHHSHIHPFYGPVIGRSGSFMIPNTGEPDPDTWYEVRVTATDTNGLSTLQSVTITPRIVTLTVHTVPEGLTFTLDGVPQTTPFAFQSVVGFQRTLNAPLTQNLNGQQYSFVAWSDSGTSQHSIITPGVDASFTASYQASVFACNSVGSNLFFGCYYDNQDLTGLALTRTDPTINFDWGGGSPDPVIGADTFSVRWIGDFIFESAYYEFFATTDDGVRVFVDGQLILDRWVDQSPSLHKTSVQLTGGIHRLTMEYYEQAGGAVANLTWAKLAGVPPAVMCPAAGTNSFTGCYYDNIDFTALALSRNDSLVNFDWGGGSPDPLIGPDTYSVRWEGNFNFESATYQFSSTADDGLRVYVDGQLILDKWIDQGPTTYTISQGLAAGAHAVKMEYYERGGGAVARLSWVKLGGPTNQPPVVGAGSSQTITLPASATLSGTASDDALPLGSILSVVWSKVSGPGSVTFSTPNALATNASFSTDGSYVLRLTASDTALTASSDLTVTVNASTSPTCGTPGANAFTGCYYDNQDFTNLKLTRTDPVINFEWGGGSPDPLIGIDTFSVRWEGSFTFEAADYQFTTTDDDGVRVYLDNVLIIDKWIDQGPTTYNVTKTLTAGSHTIKMEYYENGGGAVAKLSWIQTSGATNQPPTADAGLDQSVTLPADASLNGTASDDGLPLATLTSTWSKISGSGTVNFVSPNSLSTAASFSAAGTYTLRLTVSDGLLVSSDDVIVAVNSQAPTCGTPGTNAFTGCYYDNQDFTNLKFTRTDSTINFTWGSGSPDPAIGPDTFSVRWEGSFAFEAASYDFSATADDGVRVYVDNQLLINSWVDQGPTTYIASKSFTAGSHSVKMEYYENTVGAVAKLSWAKTGTAPPAPTCGTPGTNIFTGCYYDNQDFTNLKLTRTDPTINFTWGGGSPDPLIGADTFSVRWEGSFTFEAASYDFSATADDGVRVYVDGALIINQWKDQPSTTYTANKVLTAGNHTVKMEYYEKAGGAVAKLSWIKL